MMKPLIVLTIMPFLMCLFTACGNNNDTSKPFYAARIVGMTVSDGTGTTANAGTSSAAQSFAAAILSGVATSADSSIQNFYSGDIKWTTAYMVVTVNIQNDSNVPIKPVLMTYWDPANFPYPSDWSIDQHGVIKDVRPTGTTIQPGETATVSLNYAWFPPGYLQHAGLLSPQEITVWVYAQPSDWDMSDPEIDHTQPYFWTGTIQSMQDYISTHTPLAVATNHYNIVLPSYTDNEDGTITDNVTKLVWQKQGDGTARTWVDAQTYCSSLSLAGGNWRLPTVFELETLVDTSFQGPSIDPTYFPGTIDGYWSSTVTPDIPSKWAFDVHYTDTGTTGSDLMVNSHFVRCVK